MTTKETQELIGRQADYTLNGLTIPVRIVDVKTAFNTLKVQVQPLSGSGLIWVNATSVKFQPAIQVDRESNNVCYWRKR